jgi:hypothetical protein
MDCLQAFGHLKNLSQGHVIGVYGMIAIVCEEGGSTNGWVVVIIVGKLCHMEEVCPIILLISTEYVEICLQPLIVVLHLALCLGMIGSGDVQLMPKDLYRFFMYGAVNCGSWSVLWVRGTP